MIKITDVRGQNRKTLYEILHIDDLRQEYANAINSMSYLGAQNIDGMPHGTGVGNPTQQRALKLADIEVKKNWIMAIEQMESTLNEKQMAFLADDAAKHPAGHCFFLMALSLWVDSSSLYVCRDGACAVPRAGRKNSAEDHHEAE